MRTREDDQLEVIYRCVRRSMSGHCLAATLSLALAPWGVAYGRSLRSCSWSRRSILGDLHLPSCSRVDPSRTSDDRGRS
jgi:hypothetical protein